MKITIEIGPNRLTRFLGSQVLNLKTAASHATSSVQSKIRAFAGVVRGSVRKVGTSQG